MTTEIRSYRAVFDLERRIYRLDRLRLNPAGVPVRGVIYFLVLLAATLAAGHLPISRVVVRALPWYIVDVLIPGASAGLLAMVKIEGRPFHVAARALARHSLLARHVVRWRPARGGETRSTEGCHYWAPPEIVLLPNGSDCVIRRLRYRGPGAVLVSVGHRCEAPDAELRGPRFIHVIRRPRLRLKEADSMVGEVVVVLARGTRMRTG